MAQFNTTKLDVGTIFQKEKNGNYQFRYQVNGKRKSKTLRTKNKKDAIKFAEDMIPSIKASTKEEVAVHVQQAKGFANKVQKLELGKAWVVYDNHPDKVNPKTKEVYSRYESYFKDFTDWALTEGYNFLHEITEEIAFQYVKTLKSKKIAVDTHNKRVRRIAKIVQTLSKYHDENTSNWTNKNFKRSKKEEVNLGAEKLHFTKEQESEIFSVLDDPSYKVLNKDELRVLFNIGAYTGQRLKDCILLQWSKLDLQSNCIFVEQFKSGKAVKIPIASQLLRQIHNAKEWRDNDYVLPKLAERYLEKDSEGKNKGGALVNNDVMRVLEWIGLETRRKVEGRDRAVSVYGFHSFRHSFVSHCVANNIPRAVVVSIIGSNADIIDKHYTHVGSDAQEEAIRAISGQSKSDKEKIVEALAYLESLDEKSKELKVLETILNAS